MAESLSAALKLQDTKDIDSHLKDDVSWHT